MNDKLLDYKESKVLNLYPIDYPFETLVQRVENKKLILNPEFQRKYKWDKDGNERASKFIESALMRIPLPACYFAENEDNSHDVIDGVQRITTISNFFNDKFRLEGLSIFKELEGKLFSELGNYKSELESATLRCIILRKDNPQELIQEIFARLNQGAVQLTPQEIRHAIYPGVFDALIQDLAKDTIIANFGKGIAGTSKKDGREAEETILRFFAMNGDLNDYEDQLSKYLDKYMEENSSISSEEIERKRILFSSSLSKCKTVFGNKIFIDTNNKKHKQSLVYYDLLMWSFSKENNEFILNNIEAINLTFQQMCISEDFKKTLSGGLQNKSSIVTAAQIIIDVTDTGKGILKTNIANVFKPGFSTKKRGWGLGLTLTKRIIEQYHRGQIFVLQSEVGKGTTFRVILNK
jgi:hypothetical protein